MIVHVREAYPGALLGSGVFSSSFGADTNALKQKNARREYHAACKDYYRVFGHGLWYPPM